MNDYQTEIRVFPDASALSRFGAQLFAGAARDAVRQRGRFLAALSGGGTPLQLYQTLAEPPYRGELPWEKMHFFWGDERCVPPDDPESNYRQAYGALLSRVAVPGANIHRVPGEREPASAAGAYAGELRRFASRRLAYPRFDLVLLGLGADGHTASLFPGSQEPPGIPVLAVRAEYEGRPAHRVTLTPLVFNAARELVFLVAGEEKQRAVAAAIAGRPDPLSIPAHRIHPAQARLWWLLDEAAAGFVQRLRDEA